VFTGIIEAVGKIAGVTNKGKDLVLDIRSENLDLSDVNLGDSIAVDGVCLTVVAMNDKGFKADVSAESLQHTHIGDYQAGAQVNLEKALTLSKRLGGHIVSGHVDGVGEILQRIQDGRSIRYQVSFPSSLAKYIAEKGSITVDGVSLTVTRVDQGSFWLNIVPHTMLETTIADFNVGRRVHLEVDLLARYAERLLSVSMNSTAKSEAGMDSGTKVDEAFLAKHGFWK